MNVQALLRRLRLPALRLVTVACFFQFAGVQNGCTMAKVAGSAMGPVNPDQSLMAVSELFGGSASVPFWTLGPVREKCRDLAAAPLLVNLQGGLKLARLLWAGPLSENPPSGMVRILPLAQGEGVSFIQPSISYQPVKKYRIWKQEFWGKSEGCPVPSGRAGEKRTLQAERSPRPGPSENAEGFSQAMEAIRSVRRLHFDAGDGEPRSFLLTKIHPAPRTSFGAFSFWRKNAREREVAGLKLFLEIFAAHLFRARFIVDKMAGFNNFNTFALQKIYKKLSTIHETI